MNYHLAQLNLARMSVPVNHPAMADFVANLDRINTLAETSEGFIWRYIEERDFDGVPVFNPDTHLVNMSVWASMEALFQFTYKTGHVEIFKRRKEWFLPMEGMHMVCWYVPEGNVPTLTEARQRLDYLNTHGQTPYAFTFKANYTAEDYLRFLEENKSSL